MISKPEGSKRNRIILIYILGVVLPGIVLGYMAFRGIRSDEALREKQAHQELSLVSQDFFQNLNSDWSDLQSMENYSSINLEKEADLKIKNHSLLFLPDRFLDNQKTNQFGIIPDQGWELEFVVNDLPKAETFYKNTLNSGQTKQQSLKASMALARIQRKLKNYSGALETYNRVIENHPNSWMGHLPTSLSARMERFQIYSSTNESQDVAREWGAWASELLNPKMDISINSFDFFYTELKKNKEIHENADSLLTLLETRFSRSVYLNRFLENVDDYLRVPVNQMIYLASEGYHDLLVIEPLDSMNTRALLVNLDRYIDSDFDSPSTGLLEEDQYGWLIKDESGKNLFNRSFDNERTSFTFPFPPPLSGWMLTLQKRPGPFLSNLSESGNGLSIIIFSLLAVWLILGLIFTVYMLNQEIRLSRMKSRFISNVSHEFKSPVTSIRHMSELMKLKRVRTEEKKEEFYDSMIDQCDHLSHLIENILDFSKIEEDIKNFHFEILDAGELIGDLVQIHSNRLSESGIKINYKKTGEIPEIYADKDALQQVLYNLLDNAAKYASEGKQIDVELNFENNVILSIRDYGKGISANDQTRIFDRFYRVEDKSHEGIKGSGIGLTLVKKIVESHGGKIELESKLGEGCLFKVFLPIKTSENDKNSDN